MLHSRRSGILLHLTSLPGPHGSGDLGPSAYHFVDWLALAGQTLWQVLPLNPIGPGNSPYAGVSAFAGNPLLVALEPLVDKAWLVPDPAPAFAAARIDYAQVIPWRMGRLQAAWRGFVAGAQADERTAFATFCAREADWLDDYALFMALDAAYNPPDAAFRPWCDWEHGHAARTPESLQQARAQHSDAIGFWQFTQWCFDTQWQSLRAYARGKGIAVIGDMPIFVAHHSADCWAHPQLYQLDAAGQPLAVAGVPPDFFSSTGQRWGNPLYRWEAFVHDDYAWWAARVRRQLALADVLRIDHFRGFAACWEIPADSPTAMDGRWVAAPGVALFTALRTALGSLPIIAEDLGVITQDVEDLRDAFALPGMRVLQFGFSGSAAHAFLPHNYPPHTVAYSGTHDNDTVRGWWRDASAHERNYARLYLQCEEDQAPWAMIRSLSASVANTVIFPMQDVMGLDSAHRLNTPGQTGAWEWRFRWDWVAPDLAQRLGQLSAGFGRADGRMLQAVLEGHPGRLG